MAELKKYLIAVPCMSTMLTPFVSALVRMQRVGASKVSFVTNSLVFDARNKLAAEALDDEADRILWLDSDMGFSIDLMQRLAEGMDSGLDFVCGIYVKRQLPTSPCIYSKIVRDDDHPNGLAWVYTDYPKNQLFEIGGSGFGAVMMSTKMLKDVYDTYGQPFNPIPGGLGEDLAFCWRAKQLGYKLYCDSRIKVDHIGLYPYSEANYLAQTRN